MQGKLSETGILYKRKVLDRISQMQLYFLLSEFSKRTIVNIPQLDTILIRLMSVNQ